MLNIVVLGSAAGGGFPQWNCNCENCRRARAGDPAALARTQSSVGVCADGEHWFLLNASPDLRHQIERTPRLLPRGGPRHSPIAGVVLTNADVDHVAGLLTLREGQALNVYAAGRVHQVLSANSIFNVLDAERVARFVLPVEQDVDLRLPDGRSAGISVTAFPVPGKLALWLEDLSAGPGFGTKAEDTIGLKVTDAPTGRTFFYLPGCAAMPADLAQRLTGAQLVFFDGTTWTDDEIPAAGVGAKTGRGMGHMSMSGPDGSIAAFAELGVRRRVFIHINNTNPVLLRDSPERRQAEAAGWEIAEDGLEIVL
jgi:pyrroloquinoline quinone biosynthesis protein B